MKKIAPEYAHQRVNINTPVMASKVKTISAHSMDDEGFEGGNFIYIPAPVCECIDFYTHEEGWKTGLNDVILAKHDDFKSYLLMSGAFVKPDGDVYVPADPKDSNSERTQIGMGFAVNVSDLNIFFGRVTGAYGIPERKR
jgi:hypothetical protein